MKTVDNAISSQVPIRFTNVRYPYAETHTIHIFTLSTRINPYDSQMSVIRMQKPIRFTYLRYPSAETRMKTVDNAISSQVPIRIRNFRYPLA